MKERGIIDSPGPMSPMEFNTLQRVTYEINQWNDSELVVDQLWCVLIKAVIGGVHRACCPQQAEMLPAGELLPIPFPVTVVILTKKLRFHLCIDLALRLLAEQSKSPFLREGDIIVVDRNVRTQVTDVMNAASDPLNPIVNAESIFAFLACFHHLIRKTNNFCFLLNP